MPPVVIVDELESDDDRSLFLTLPSGFADACADVFASVPTPCYGRGSCVDVLELRGGTGGMSHFAWKRNLAPGGNLDKRANACLGNPQVQQAVEHSVHVCFIAIVILQPNVRLASFSNSHGDCDGCRKRR
eukprot:8707765-Pyramimonas_sp.AAC.1